MPSPIGQGKPTQLKKAYGRQLPDKKNQRHYNIVHALLFYTYLNANEANRDGKTDPCGQMDIQKPRRFSQKSHTSDKTSTETIAKELDPEAPMCEALVNMISADIASYAKEHFEKSVKKHSPFQHGLTLPRRKKTSTFHKSCKMH